jgi:hypothetical protein
MRNLLSRTLLVTAVVGISVASGKAALATGPAAGWLFGITPSPKNGISPVGTNFLPNGEWVDVTLYVNSDNGSLWYTQSPNPSHRVQSATVFEPGDVIPNDFTFGGSCFYGTQEVLFVWADIKVESTGLHYSTNSVRVAGC